jgi:hypothetical protein
MKLNLFKKFEFNYYWADTWIPSAILNYIDEKSIDELLKYLEEENTAITTYYIPLDFPKVEIERLLLNLWFLTIKNQIDWVYELWYPNIKMKSEMKKIFNL